MYDSEVMGRKRTTPWSIYRDFTVIIESSVRQNPVRSELSIVFEWIMPDDAILDRKKS